MESQTKTTDPASDNGHHRFDDQPNPAKRALHDVPIYLAELKTYIRYFLSAKVDGAKAGARKAVMYAALGVVGLFAAIGMIFTAVFLVLSSLAIGLGHLFGTHAWLGGLIVGLLVLGTIGLGMWLVIRKITGASRAQTEKKYERKQVQQRAEFGSDVTQRAGTARS